MVIAYTAYESIVILKKKKFIKRQERMVNIIIKMWQGCGLRYEDPERQGNQRE